MDDVQRALRGLVGTGGSMKTFAENWPAAREIIAATGQTAAEAKAAGEQAMAAWKKAEPYRVFTLGEVFSAAEVLRQRFSGDCVLNSPHLMPEWLAIRFAELSGTDRHSMVKTAVEFATASVMPLPEALRILLDAMN